ncbi:glycosyl transferase [Lacisediminihabitans sp. H27-G8]|uniref:glycosyl transferase n=1 Tax=Lacisediminihabitans sp. H27-G8 TaxID=3111909 RepID=UPI0038FC1E05
MTSARSARPPHAHTLVVLQSFPSPRPTTNPYLVMLADALRQSPGVSVLNFDWKTALTGRYDLYHSHWPEILARGSSPAKSLARQALTVLFYLRLRATRTPVVRTMHNVERPDGLTRREVILLDWFDRLTTLRIRLNESTTVEAGQPVETIPHGHYREWYRDRDRSSVVPGQFGYVGLIRRYKGVESLIGAFRQLDDRALSLRVGGKPSTVDLAESVEGLARGDERIALHLQFLSDQELVDVVTSSEMVVLPYLFMHNSGGTLAALSLDRPVIVPDNAVNVDLAAEVGEGWVHRYSGELTGEVLGSALAAARTRPSSAHPDLSARDWTDAGRAHVAAYRRAAVLASEGR